MAAPVPTGAAAQLDNSTDVCSKLGQDAPIRSGSGRRCPSRSRRRRHLVTSSRRHGVTASPWVRRGPDAARSPGARCPGRAAIAARAGALWASGPGYLADPRCVARSDDLALVVGPTALNVARRGRDGLVAVRHLASRVAGAMTGRAPRVSCAWRVQPNETVHMAPSPCADGSKPAARTPVIGGLPTGMERRHVRAVECAGLHARARAG
jgi:hypothetical protein